MCNEAPLPKALGRPAGFDREAVLQIAMDLLWEGGFETTSVGELIAAMGLSRSSFYAAFGSKRGAMLAALQLYSARCDALLREIATRDGTFQDRLSQMLHAIAMVDDARGCFMVNCISEMARHDPEIRKIAAEHNDALEQILVEALPEGDGAAARAKARALVAAAYGATLLVASGTDRAAIREMLDTLARAA
ncbi:TetR/AcrR family transcriptional regulator [Palleronia sp. LCG004]|uniref:TetR/AcrR family transcriptional regulator n=1 Tax=Palleronia sp. LCG004 TaxID=3079304 RepID=UPI002942DCD3|nr:TetR/AcrR family transcriptional regulator [Palleronia sp. LCG004]WOI57722.1 TetR/AcrR family transcriptional regulator [Palleronia sp. LCG004]